MSDTETYRQIEYLERMLVRLTKQDGDLELIWSGVEQSRENFIESLYASRRRANKLVDASSRWLSNQIDDEWRLIDPQNDSSLEEALELVVTKLYELNTEDEIKKLTEVFYSFGDEEEQEETDFEEILGKRRQILSKAIEAAVDVLFLV